MFSTCLDESTDITSIASLAVAARFLSRNIIKEDWIKLMTLSKISRGQDIMGELKEFMELSIKFRNTVSDKNGASREYG